MQSSSRKRSIHTPQSRRPPTDNAASQDTSHLEALIASLDAVVFEIDEQGIILNVWTRNDAALFRPAAEFLGKPIEASMGPELAAQVLPAIRTTLETGECSTVRYASPPPHERRWWNARFNRIEEAGQPTRRVSCVISDITGQKNTEDALAVRTEEVENFFQCTVDLLCIASTDGYFLKVNPEWEQTLGYSVGELEGRRFLDLVHPDDLQPTLAAISELAGNKRVLNFTNRYRCRDGSWRWIEWRSFPAGTKIYAAARDITERIQAQQQLQERETSYRTLAENLPCIVYRIDIRDNFRMTFFNTMVETITGRSIAQLQEAQITTLDPLMHPEDRDQVIAAMRRAIAATQPFMTTYRLCHRDGTYRTVREHGRIIAGPDDRPHYIDGVIFDVSEQVAASAALQESLKKFDSLFDNMVEGVALHELVENGDGTPVDYRIIDVNRQFGNIVGINREHARGQLATHLYGTSQAPFLERYSAVARTRTPDFFSTYFEPMDRYFSISIVPWGVNGFATIFADITDRTRAEQQLAAEKERLAVTLRSIGDGVITTDVQGRVTMINKVAEELTGWSVDEARGRPLVEIFNIIHESTRLPHENPVQKVLETGMIAELANHTLLIARDGRERVIADSGAPIRDRESRIIGVVLVFRDITDKQRIEESLHNTQRIESLGILAGGLAHDFNNLLGGIFGYIDCAREFAQYSDLENTRLTLNKAFAVFNRAKALTQQLLTFAKGGAPIKTTMQIAPLIRNAAEFMLSGSTVRAEFDIADDLSPCDVDAGQLGQVIDNIILNARQAMPQGGVCTIRAANAIQDGNLPPVLLGTWYVRISISDQGPGIPAEHLSHIFDPFFTTKPHGSGLGLTTAFSILKRHDGCIEALSVPGQGATFNLYLPVSTSRQTDMPPPPSSNAHTGRGRILVMDDEDFICEIAADMLGKMGYHVVTCQEGSQALELYRNASEHRTPFDLVILDLTIPGGMGGKETAEKLHQFDPRARIIASSGYSDDPVMAAPQKYGLIGRLIKPYLRQEVADLMARLNTSDAPPRSGTA